MSKKPLIIGLSVAVLTLMGYVVHSQLPQRSSTPNGALRVWLFPDPESGDTDDKLLAVFNDLIKSTTYVQPEDQWGDAPNDVLANDTYVVEIKTHDGLDDVWVNGVDTGQKFERIFRNRCCAMFAPFPTLTTDGRFIFTNYTLHSAELVEIDLKSLDAPVAIPSGWQTVDTGKFTIALPSGWEYVPSRGIDSFVGEFVGDGVTLSFDYGWYSGIPEYNDASNVTVTTETIGGYSAQLVVPTVPGSDTVGVYFSDLGNDNRLSITSDARTAEEQEVVLEIFKSIQFAP